MNVQRKNKDIIIENTEDFSIEQTLECGQCFNFHKLDENEYVITAMERLLHVSQKEDTLVFYNIEEGDAELWINYLDLNRDYGKIKRTLIKNAPELKEAIDDKWGVRILNQEFPETLMSFIISQNKQIPHIKQIVKTISKEYGKSLGMVKGCEYFGFPDIEALNNIGLLGYQKCKTGFRARYLEDAACKMKDGLCAKSFEGMEYDEALLKLKEIKGVGDKVANCVLLFGLGYRNAFPVDVWVKRVMEEVYFKEDTSKEKIMEFAKERYGEYGGYAQQYLFYHRRG